jgi:hypothetical protein
MYATNEIDGASENGHVAVLQWWKDSGLRCRYSSNVMDLASSNGHDVILKWWKISGLKCKWTECCNGYS